MPELPELEGVAQLLDKNIKFTTIKDVSINNASLLVNIRGFELKKALRKQTFVDVERRGKFLIMTLHDGNAILLHLGITGVLQLLPAPNPIMDINIELCNNMYLVIGNDHNSESKAGVKLYFTKSEPILSDLGPEPLSPEFNVQWLHKKCQRTEMPIKLVLLDQAVAAGIGNFYADYILWEANVSPTSKANSLTVEALTEIVNETKTILRDMIANSLIVLQEVDTYNFYTEQKIREGAAIRRSENSTCSCCSHQMMKVQLGGRDTFYCPYCQA